MESRGYGGSHRHFTRTPFFCLRNLETRQCRGEPSAARTAACTAALYCAVAAVPTRVHLCPSLPRLSLIILPNREYALVCSISLPVMVYLGEAHNIHMNMHENNLSMTGISTSSCSPSPRKRHTTSYWSCSAFCISPLPAVRCGLSYFFFPFFFFIFYFPLPNRAHPPNECYMSCYM